MSSKVSMTGDCCVGSIVIVSLVLGCRDETGPASSRSNGPENEPVLVLTDESFEREILAGPQPVLIDFWAAWCRRCLEMKPVLRELAHVYAGRAKVAELNIDDNPFMKEKYGVESLPALLLFRDGELVERVHGSQSKAELERLLESQLPPSAPAATQK